MPEIRMDDRLNPEGLEEERLFTSLPSSLLKLDYIRLYKLDRAKCSFSLKMQKAGQLLCLTGFRS